MVLFLITHKDLIKIVVQESGCPFSHQCGLWPGRAKVEIKWEEKTPPSCEGRGRVTGEQGRYALPLPD